MAKTELQQISERIRSRAALESRDRARQRELIRQRIRVEGKTWDEVEKEAGVSRPTIRKALNRED